MSFPFAISDITFFFVSQKTKDITFFTNEIYSINMLHNKGHVNRIIYIYIY